MDQIVQMLMSRLAEKGLTLEQISGLIRDVENSINSNGDIDASMVRQKLTYLGWEEEILDEYIFQLILPILNEKGGRHAWVEKNLAFPESRVFPYGRPGKVQSL